MSTAAAAACALHVHVYVAHVHVLPVFRFLSLTGHLKCKDYCWVPFTGDALLFRFQQVMEDFSRNNTTSLTTLVSRLKLMNRYMYVMVIRPKSKSVVRVYGFMIRLLN